MRLVVAGLGLACVLAGPLHAQAGVADLTPEQIQAFQENPQLVRDWIRRSGLSPEEIRARLRAAGYATTLLDPYLAAAPGEAPAPGDVAVQALRALGLPFAAADSALAPDTGAIKRPATPSRVFGVEAFHRTTTQFLPALSGPVPPDYVLGPGDALVLIITGDVELTYQLTVSREGFVVIPQVGQVQVASLTLDQLRDVLYTRLGRAYSGISRRPSATTSFHVSVASVRVNQVYVTGEVTQPGAYQISALGSALTALYAAGGVTERANMRAIAIRRNGETVSELDLYDYLLDGDTRNDIRLETGDVIFVPVRGSRVGLSGAVVREGIYEVRADERLADMIAAAGGFRADADLERLTIHRILPAVERGPGGSRRAAIDVELTPVSDAAPRADRRRQVAIPPLALQDGDSIVVHRLPPLGQSYFVRVTGMVQRPDSFPWREGMTLRDLMALAGGPQIGADLREAEIARMPQDRSSGALAEVIRVPMDSSYIIHRDAAGRYAGPPGPPFPPPGSVPEMELQPFDQVLILQQPEFELQRTVTITGEVRFPGPYALVRKDERVSDLIARAGGLLNTAYPEGARLIRSLNAAGRVNVDLPGALAEARGRRDVVLQPGDSLHVPEYDPTVRVRGAVNAPTSVLYREGEGLGYYIENAGGYAQDANKGQVSVRYANGSARVRGHFLFFRSSPTPGPGSEIFVPSRDPREGFNVTQFLTAVAQILASTVAIIAIATR